MPIADVICCGEIIVGALSLYASREVVRVRQLAGSPKQPLGHKARLMAYRSQDANFMRAAIGRTATGSRYGDYPFVRASAPRSFYSNGGAY